MKLVVNNDYVDVSHYDLEIVERKGLGHPDTLADGLAESISINYSKYCLKKFNVIPRHNVDKVMLMGGLASINWGSVEYKKPVRVLVNGRISPIFGEEKIPVQKIIDDTVYDFFKKRLPDLNSQNIEIIHESTNYTKQFRWFNPNSAADLPEYQNRYANDTSSVVGHWPYTLTEYLALKLESHFYIDDIKPRYEYCGQDIKVMIVRNGNFYNITMCVPILASRVNNREEYIVYKSQILKDLEFLIQKTIPDNSTFELQINNNDSKNPEENDPTKYYILATGSSLDFGEEGVVGRGNNRKGVISSGRHYSMEAAWGKNPHYHVGKVLGYVVDELSKKISEKYDCESRLWAITRIGDRLFEPNYLILDISKDLDKEELELLIKSELNNRDWSKEIIDNSVLVPKPYKD